MLHEPLSAADPRSVTRWGRPQGGVAPPTWAPSFDANGQDLDPAAALRTSFQLLSSGERLDTAHAGRARLATLATTEQQVSQRRARRLWKACAFVLAVDAVAAVQNAWFYQTRYGLASADAVVGHWFAPLALDIAALLCCGLAYDLARTAGTRARRSGLQNVGRIDYY